jgi:hypothetical protein
VKKFKIKLFLPIKHNNNNLVKIQKDNKHKVIKTIYLMMLYQWEAELLIHKVKLLKEMLQKASNNNI